MEVWVLPRAEPLHQDLRAVVVRVRDGQWSRLAELGLRTRTLVLTNTKPAQATGMASSRALPWVGTAGAVGS